MQVFTPTSDTTFGIQRGDGLLHRPLRAMEPYLLNDVAAAVYEERITAGQVQGMLQPADERPLTEDSRRVLVFFTGEVGDAVCTRIPLLWWATDVGGLEVAVVTASGDEALFGVDCVFGYPITLRQAGTYDTWVEFDVRACPGEELSEAFVRAIGIPVGVVEPPSAPLPSKSLRNAVQRLCADTGRPRVGIILHADSHYRSWPIIYAWPVVQGLVKSGFDCYIIGPGTKRVIFKVDGQAQELWGDGFYDASGLLGSLEERIAFLSCMDAVVAPDCGMLQVACALRKPTVGIFGPTSGQCRSKYAPTLRYFDGAKDCSPCWCVGDRPHCEGRWCEAIEAIETEKVIETVKTMLEGNHATDSQDTPQQGR